MPSACATVSARFAVGRVVPAIPPRSLWLIAGTRMEAPVRRTGATGFADVPRTAGH